ncbi:MULTISPECIES: tRNA glutamyl-Q(34) synthetase GluQRS [unclassified Rhizobium]|uniref:tRNA glutamyl-Q(34) synthetase GluQRS n=1 Tax=unclassified Rhizobium TaxID=2613769 RepID=UPI0037F21312
MIEILRQKPKFRFAPSPNGSLHLGHALSAILNHEMAAKAGGDFLLRIEDIDQARCTPDFETGIYADLSWLGLHWQEPVRRQSEHFPAYQRALQTLVERGLVYPAFLTRGEVKARVATFEAGGSPWPRDPDGTPLYPPDDRDRSDAERQRLLASGMKHAWRLDMKKAMAAIGDPLHWHESGDGETGAICADPAAWGDVVLSRSDAPSSYHLSVVVDDAVQGITHVVRGLDLFHATSIHRLLQRLLGLPEPLYHHHRLLLGSDGKKLSKSMGDIGIGEWRQQGLSPAELRRRIGL